MRVSRVFCALLFAGLCGEIFGVPMRTHRVLMRLLGEFVGGEMISFAVRSGCGGVGVGRKVVEFGCPVMCALWHRVLLDTLDAVMGTFLWLA